MFNHNIKSNKYLDEAINQFASLPGIGRKTALKFVLHLLKKNLDEVEKFSNAIYQMKKDIKICKICANISDNDICNICSNTKRENSLICVVENIQDVMIIESTMQYKGLYHILGGVISPIDGVGPNNLNIDALMERINNGENKIKELILALPTTMEGDTTSFYIYKKINNLQIQITSLARGVAIGEELQYTDEITLAQSIMNRKPFISKT